MTSMLRVKLTFVPWPLLLPGKYFWSIIIESIISSISIDIKGFFLVVEMIDLKLVNIIKFPMFLESALLEMFGNYDCPFKNSLNKSIH